MNHTGTEHDNEILVDFNILFDTDLAIYKIIKSKYRNIPYTDKRLMKIDNEYQAIFLLLMREKNNPLSILMPEVNSDKLYQQFLNDKETLFKYTKQTDLFRFMHILSINASSISITIQCEDEAEAIFVTKICNKYGIGFNLIIQKKTDINIDGYTTLYIKYLSDLIKFTNIQGKNIYISNAGYNLNINDYNIRLSAGLSVMNIIKTIDMYEKVKYINLEKLIKESNL